ncbi:MAG: glycosyltransferase family 2 protein [Bacteroidales bacterium]|nr:glycosyltransferase family 2 protein [Candidatus Physcocola equi]MDO4970465.1 glycosyltransferase family 2 protein [Bacteroidales bacterium]
MDKNPKISVVIPVYKTEATLPRCVDSVLKQSFQNFEIVIVDDGSPDRAGEIADHYAKKYNNIVVVHKRNGGLAEARKSGIKVASGEFIVPLDSDDELPKNALEVLLGRCEIENLDLCYGTYMRVEGDRRRLFHHSFTGVMNGDEFRVRNLTVGNNYGSCFCISRRVIWRDDVFPPAEKRFPSEDVMINTRLSKYLKRVGIYNDCVYNYYLNPESLSISGQSRQELWSDFFGELRRYLQSEGFLDEAMEHLLRIREVDHLGFYVKDIDKQSRWYKDVMSYDCSKYPIKTRTLHVLLHCPALLRFCIKMNRMVKKLIN